MQSLPVVDLIDEAGDAGSGVGEVTVLRGVDLLDLQRFHEALGHGVVIRTSGAAYAGLDAGLFQPIDIIALSILNASAE